MGGEFVSRRIPMVQDILIKRRVYPYAGIFPPLHGPWAGLAMVFLPFGKSPQDHPFQLTSRGVRSDDRSSR
jgi:hypothetical protein